MYRSITRFGLGIIVALTAMAMPLTAHAVSYTAANTIDLNPATLLGTGTNSYGFGAFGNQQVGYGFGGNTGGNSHALLWTSTAASAIDLNPATLLGTNSNSFQQATSSSQQVGYGYGGNTGGISHALLWTGTAASAVDLNPASLLGINPSSFAYSTTGSQQVGYGYGGSTGNISHALLWTGTAASAVDLNPASLLGTSSLSNANATSGSQQVGYGHGGNTGNVDHALLWTGSAASAVDLNPATLLGTSSTSIANGTSGSQQVGDGSGGNTGGTHALLWTGTAASAVDLNPASLLGTGSQSFAYATSGSQQVGYGRSGNTGGNNHALLWSGTAASAVDLHALLPAGFYSSQALAIDPYGNIVGIAFSALPQQHAVEWLAGDLYNVGGTGAWATNSNWTAAAPTAGSDVLLLQQDATNRTITYSSAGTSPALGNMTIDATGSGTITVSQTGGTLSATNETIGFIGNGAYTQTGGTHLVSGTLTLAAGSASQGTYTLNNGAAVLNAGTISVNSGGTFNQTAGTLVSNFFYQQGGAVTGTLTNQGNFIYSSGAFSGRLVNNGSATLNAAFTAGNGIENDGSLSISRANPVTVNGAGLDNFGNLTLNGGLLAGSGSVTNDVGGVFNAHGTIGPTFTNYGQLSTTGLLVLNSSFTNYGPVSISSGQGLRAIGSFTNAGPITLDGGSLSGGSATGITNTPGGIIQGSGGVSNLLLNSGGLIQTNTNSTLVLTNFSGNSGGGMVVGAGGQINVTTPFTSSGYIQLLGSGAICSGGAITNSGTVKGSGTVSNSVLNGGVIRAEAGELDFTGSGNTNAAAGQIQAAANNTVMYVQGLAINAGTIALTGGTLDNNSQPLSNTSTGVITGYGTLRTGAPTNTVALTNTGKLNVGEGNMDVFGNVSNNGTIGIQGSRYIYFYGNVNGSGSYTGTGTAVYLAAVSPGNSPATVSFGGNVDLTSAATLNIELGGTTAGTQYDQLHVAGQLSLGGALNVVLYSGFVPAAGNSFDILDWGSLSGNFSTIQLPTLAGGLAWNTSQLYTSGVLSVGLPGDFNFNGVVDAADYVVWRKGLGTTYTQDDYNVWRTHFGQTAPGAGSGSGAIVNAAIPEPATLVLLMFAAAGWCFRRDRAV